MEFVWKVNAKVSEILWLNCVHLWITPWNLRLEKIPSVHAMAVHKLIVGECAMWPTAPLRKSRNYSFEFAVISNEKKILFIFFAWKKSINSERRKSIKKWKLGCFGKKTKKKKFFMKRNKFRVHVLVQFECTYVCVPNPWPTLTMQAASHMDGFFLYIYIYVFMSDELFFFIYSFRFSQFRDIGIYEIKKNSLWMEKKNVHYRCVDVGKKRHLLLFRISLNWKYFAHTNETANGLKLSGEWETTTIANLMWMKIMIDLGEMVWCCCFVNGTIKEKSIGFFCWSFYDEKNLKKFITNL